MVQSTQDCHSIFEAFRDGILSHDAIILLREHKILTSDFEQSLRLAVYNVWPDCQRVGCNFLSFSSHSTKSALIASTINKNKYFSNSSSISKNVHEIKPIAFSENCCRLPSSILSTHKNILKILKNLLTTSRRRGSVDFHWKYGESVRTLGEQTTM